MLFRPTYLVVLFCVFLVVGTSTNANSSSKHSERLLLEHLLQNYDKNARPQGDTGTVYVEMYLNLRRIVNMDIKAQVLTNYVWLYQKWTDELLRWDPNEFENITDIRIPAKEIWKPDLELYNSASEDVSLSDDGITLAVVRSDGNVSWIEPKTISTVCPVDVTYFPFDQQTCKITIGSWSHHGFQIDMQMQADELELEAFAYLAEWKIVNTSTVKSSVYYSCCPEPFTDITSTMTIMSSLFPLNSFYVCTIILPWVMLSIITALILTLPLDSAVRVVVQMFMVAAFCICISWDVTGELPNTANSTPLILFYMVVMIMLSGLSVILTIGIRKISNYGQRTDSTPLPQWLRMRNEDSQVVKQTLSQLYLNEKWTLSGETSFHVANSSTRNLKGNLVVGATSTDVTSRDDIPLTQFPALDPVDQLEESPSDVPETGAMTSNPVNRKISVSGCSQLGAPTNIQNRSSMFPGQRCQNEYSNPVSDEWRLLANKLDAVCCRLFAVSIIMVNLSLIILAL